MLLPSEREAMVRALEDAKVPLQATKVNPSKTGQSLTPALQALMSKSPELKVRSKPGSVKVLWQYKERVVYASPAGPHVQEP